MGVMQVFVDDHTGEVIRIDRMEDVHTLTIVVEDFEGREETLKLDLGDESMRKFLERNEDFIESARRVAAEAEKEDAPATPTEPKHLGLKSERSARNMPHLEWSEAMRMAINRYGVQKITEKLREDLLRNGRLKIRGNVSHSNARQLQDTASKYGIQLFFNPTHRARTRTGGVVSVGEVYAELA